MEQFSYCQLFLIESVLISRQPVSFSGVPRAGYVSKIFKYIFFNDGPIFNFKMKDVRTPKEGSARPCNEEVRLT